MALSKVYGEPIEKEMQRGSSDTDDIILNIKKSKVAVDVTGWTANIKINDAKDGSGTTHFTGSGIPYGDPINGQIVLDMSAFDATSYTGTKYYDIQLIDSLGKKRDYITGPISIIQRID